MEYLQHLYTKFFGAWDEGATEQNGVSTPKKIIAFGNVLVDRTVQVDDFELFKRFQIKPGSKGELDLETLTNLTLETCGDTNCKTNPGGSALNTVRILKHLGTEALFFGAVGADKNAEVLTDIFKERGIYARLQTVDDSPTGQCICLVYEDRPTLYANIGASAKFSVDFLKNAERVESQTFLRSIERKQILYIEGFFVPQREHVCDFIVTHYVRERRRLALNLSAAYIVEENICRMWRLVQRAFFVFGNLKEFQMFCTKLKCENFEQMAEQLMGKGDEPKIIVITMGPQGVQLITNYVDEHAEPGAITFQTFNAPRVENVVDTTGAGDAFVAGFLHAWLAKRSLSECVRVGTDIAAKVITQIGCNLP